MMCVAPTRPARRDNPATILATPAQCSPDPVAPAPAASPIGLLAMLAAVVLVAFLAIRAKRQA
jgi:hypothetical protein